MDDDRRIERRHPANGFAHIYEIPTGSELGLGEISDISSSGASVRIYCPLKIGASIELRQDGDVYYGVIRYCVPDGADFRIGIQLTPPQQWSPERSWPSVSPD